MTTDLPVANHGGWWKIEFFSKVTDSFCDCGGLVFAASNSLTKLKHAAQTKRDLLRSSFQRQPTDEESKIM